MDIEVGEAGWRNEAFAEDQKGKMLVFFHTEQVRQNFASTQEGRPVFKPVIHITKVVPGDNRLKIVRPLRETDAEEWPMEWARFEQKKSAMIVGTPIAAWPIINETQQAEFKALNIHTIDQFANLPDSAGEKIMGFNDLREKARRFIAAAKDSAQFDRIQRETDAKLAAQDEEMNRLRAKLEALTKQATSPRALRPTKRRLSQEQRDAASARMKAMHEKRRAAA